MVPDPLAEWHVIRALALALAGVALLPGCGEDCQSSCARIYDEAECGVQVPGASIDDLRRECVDGCQVALTQPGDMDGYNPYEAVPPVSEWEDFNFKDDGNEKQVAEWMNCVAATDCEQLQLDQGLCWPIN